MARRKTKSGVGGSVRAQPSFSEETAVKLRGANVVPNPSYRYTTPSFSGKRPAKDRRDKGCIEDPRDRWCFQPEGKTESGKKKGPKCYHSEAEAVEEAGGRAVSYSPEKKFTGYRCRSGKPKEGEKCVDRVYDPFCAGSDSVPCGSPRSTCPVQLIWVDGKPNLRFCKEQGKPGHLVPVKDVSEAMAVSDEACKAWPYKLGVVERTDGSESEGGWDPEFFERNAPQIIKSAKKSYPKQKGLGELQPARRQGNPVWLAAGIAMGVVGAVLLQRRQLAAGGTT
jgi:hypothetical protein